MLKFKPVECNCIQVSIIKKEKKKCARDSFLLPFPSAPVVSISSLLLKHKMLVNKKIIPGAKRRYIPPLGLFMPLCGNMVVVVACSLSVDVEFGPVVVMMVMVVMGRSAIVVIVVIVERLEPVVLQSYIESTTHHVICAAGQLSFLQS
jgi:hypothetical protein